MHIHNLLANNLCVLLLFIYVPVYKCLQPLMISLSYQGMMNTVDRAVKHYDETLINWRDNLVSHIKVHR